MIHSLKVDGFKELVTIERGERKKEMKKRRGKERNGEKEEKRNLGREEKKRIIIITF